MPRNKKAELHKEAKERQTKKTVNPSADHVVIVNEKNTQGKKPQEKRSRQFCLVTYIEPSKLEWFLVNSEWVQHWAYCTHNNDLKDDGTLKEVHTHVLLYTYDGKTASAIKKNFDRYSAEITSQGQEAQNTMSQIMHDSGYQWRYLIHKDDKDKYQYSSDLRICDNLGYWSKLERTEGLTDSSFNSGLAMLDDLLNGVCTYKMVQRYGKEYIYHSTHFKNILVDMARESLNGDIKATFNGLHDMCRLALADSTYTEQQLTLFFGMLLYCQSKFEYKQLSEEVVKYLKA